ncbi:hypothetical protein [Streptomyces sp. NPDC055085]
MIPGPHRTNERAALPSRLGRRVPCGIRPFDDQEPLHPGTADTEHAMKTL